MKKSKYGNKKVQITINSEIYKFDSKKELKRFRELYALAKSGEITELVLQPKYLLIDTLRLAGHKTLAKRSYSADFRYKNKLGETIVEDVKASAKFQDPVYRIKKHLFLEKYGKELQFKEIY